MTPKGSAFLYARPELQGLLNPLVISHGWTAESKEPGAKGAFGNSPFIDEIEMQGTRDPSAWLSVPAAIAFRKRARLDRACSAIATPWRRRRPAASASSPGLAAAQLARVLRPRRWSPCRSPNAIRPRSTSC